MTLFPGYEPEQTDALSAGRRLTLRQKRDIENGVHPLMRGPTDTTETCGSCVHRVLRGPYPKCDLTTMPHSAASDVRAWWPACTRWEKTKP